MCVLVLVLARNARSNEQTNERPKGLEAFEGVGRILFSNGGRDPWHAAGGVNLAGVPSTERVPVVHIPSGAHHIDLRVSSPFKCAAKRA